VDTGARITDPLLLVKLRLTPRPMKWRRPLEFLAEAREAAELRRKEAAKCKMCDGTGYKDHAGFAMDPCSCARRDPSHSAPAK